MNHGFQDRLHCQKVHITGNDTNNRCVLLGSEQTCSKRGLNRHSSKRGEKRHKRNWVSRTGWLRKLQFGRVVAGWRRGPAHKTGATEVRHAISVFESALNLMCDVEGCAPLCTDFPHGGQREKHGLL